MTRWRQHWDRLLIRFFTSRIGKHFDPDGAWQPLEHHEEQEN